MRHLGHPGHLGLALAPAARAAEKPAEPGEACEDSGACRARFGNGSICQAGRCEPYRDETDLFIAVGLTQKKAEHPKAFEPLL
jgi:hypothetical protein